MKVRNRTLDAPANFIISDSLSPAGELDFLEKEKSLHERTRVIANAKAEARGFGLVAERQDWLDAGREVLDESEH